MSTTIRDIGIPGLDLEVSVRNMLDKDYETPGTDGPHTGRSGNGVGDYCESGGE